MNLDAVPAELRARRQWVVWKSIVADGKVTKPPYNPHNTSWMASVTEPTTWGSFEDAVAVYQANPSVISGIGYVFTEDDDFFGIDIDDEAKVKPEFVERRRQFVSQILAEVDTYSELSPSGKGIHMIGKGRLPVAGKRSSSMQVEVYCAMRYFTITGDVINGRSTINDQQSFLISVFGAMAPEPSNNDDVVYNTEAHRSLSLTDEEVIRMATNYNPTFAPRYNCQMGCGPGEWSDTFMAVVGMLDRFSGNVEQVERIIMYSPMVQSAPPSGAGEKRVDKAKRNFAYVLRRVREGNNGLLHFAEHGRQIVEAMEKAKAERGKLAAEALRRAEETIAGMSKGSQSVLDAFPQLTTEHKLLTRPPGLIGEYVLATEKGSFKPFTKFAIPATFSTLAGVVARGFKLPGGAGLNVNFILAAPSNAGKTQTMDAWQRFMQDAANALGSSLSGPSHTRITNSSTSSIQAMMQDFMATPSMVWYVEECYSLLSSMNEGKSPTEAHLRDAFNQLYDAGKHGKMFSGPRSVANRKAEIEPVNNLNVSTFWTTTTSKFDVFSEDALDGFLSRVIVIRHHAPGGEPMQYVEELPAGLRDVLIQRLAQAKHLDENYHLNAFEAGKLLTFISTEQVADLHWQFVRTVDAISNAAIEGKLPPVYGAISRLPLTAQRLAGIMAVIENPFTPSISEPQYKWAFGYLLQNLVSLLTDVDKGELGSGASDEVLAVVKGIKDLLKRKEYVGMPGVPKQVLRDYLKQRKPFSQLAGQGYGGGRSQKVSDTIAHMLKEGMLDEVTLPSNGVPGRPATCISPVLSDPVWG